VNGLQGTIQAQIIYYYFKFYTPGSIDPRVKNQKLKNKYPGS